MDLGSNTFHLLSADVRNGVIYPLVDAKVAVRIGEGAFADGAISRSAFDRGIDAIEELLAPLGGTKPLTVATGVFREAANAGEFLDEVRRRFDLEVRIISWQEEAELTYRAVCAEALDPDARIAAFDLGGGSLECIIGQHGRVELAQSFPLGALRLARQLEGADMVGRVEQIVTLHAGAMLEQIRAREPEAVVFTSGTARTLLRIARAIGCSEPVVGCLSTSMFVTLALRMATMSPCEAASAGVPASRCDTIGAGAAVFAAIVQRLRVPFVHITQGALREGLALHATERYDLARRASARQRSTADTSAT